MVHRAESIGQRAWSNEHRTLGLRIMDYGLRIKGKDCEL